MPAPCCRLGLIRAFTEKRRRIRNPRILGQSKFGTPESGEAEANGRLTQAGQHARTEKLLEVQAMAKTVLVQYPSGFKRLARQRETN